MKRNTKEGILEVHWTTGSGNWETWMYGRQLDNWDYYFPLFAVSKHFSTFFQKRLGKDLFLW